MQWQSDWVINCVHFWISVDLFTNKFRRFVQCVPLSRFQHSEIWWYCIYHSIYHFLPFQSIWNGSPMIPAFTIHRQIVCCAKKFGNFGTNMFDARSMRQPFMCTVANAMCWVFSGRVNAGRTVHVFNPHSLLWHNRFIFDMFDRLWPWEKLHIHHLVSCVHTACALPPFRNKYDYIFTLIQLACSVCSIAANAIETSQTSCITSASAATNEYQSNNWWACE